jgi:type II secretory pathway pseudopilin PulG
MESVSMTAKGITMQRRQAFTLVEMLVAMALTLFIMVITTTAFITGLDTFRMLKGLGDLQQGLRGAAQRLRTDLQANHFIGKGRMSSPLFWMPGNQQPQGFVRIENINPGTPEGNDLDALPLFRVTAHRLLMTNRLIGNRPENFYNAWIPTPLPPLPQAPNQPRISPLLPGSPNYRRTNFFDQPADARFQQGNTYSSQWAEIGYHLAKTGATGLDNGIPLYALYRIQRVVVPDNSQINGATDPNGNWLFPASDLAYYLEMSCQLDPTGQWIYFNSPVDLARGLRSIGGPDTRVTGNVAAGANTITVFDATGFVIGDQFVIDGPNADGETGQIQIMIPNKLPMVDFQLVTPLTKNHTGQAPVRRIGFPTVLEDSQPLPNPPNGTLPYTAGSSLLLTNVVSFQVQVLRAGDDQMRDVVANVNIPSYPAYFDTSVWTNPLNVTAIQVVIRVWDPATLQTRQISIIQDM